ncbi:MAG: hypothetical protein H8F28_08950 [Fibrella sp.]|nr:hypothetical protein [Armatimonadota bacterium]
MKVVLKPAGILLILVVIATLAWLVVSDQAKMLFAPTGPDASQGFVNVPGSKASPGVAKTRTASASAAVPSAINQSTGSADLTRLGKTDWVLYGVLPGTLPAKSPVRKKVARNTVAPVEFVGNGTVASYGNDTRAFRWSDGPGGNTSGDGVRTGIVTAGLASGFRVIVTPTAGRKQTMMVWVGGTGVRSKLHARMSDGAPLSKLVESYKDISAGGKFAFRSLYTVYFSATKPEQKLILSYLVAEEGKNGIGAPKGAVPDESSVSLQAIAVD